MQWDARLGWQPPQPFYIGRSIVAALELRGAAVLSDRHAGKLWRDQVETPTGISGLPQNFAKSLGRW